MDYYTVLIERERDGGFNAWSPDVPNVYASGRSRQEATRRFRTALAAHAESYADDGEAMPLTTASVLTLRHAPRARAGDRWKYVSTAGALLGRRTSTKRAEASRKNGLKGGRPRKRGGAG